MLCLCGIIVTPKFEATWTEAAMKRLDWGVRGVIVPLITPFKDDLSIDWNGLRVLVDHCVEVLGCDGLIPCGTTGESPTLSHAEHAEVIRVVAEHAAGRVPVIAGTGSNSTREAIDLSVLARECGVDALLQVCPYYNRPTQSGIVAHMKAVAEAVDMPIILYNIPTRTGRNIEPATIVRLVSEAPQIVGLKDASGDLHQAMEVMRATDGEGFLVYSGEDVLTFPLACLGAAGTIAAVAHVIGREVREMCRAVWEGRIEEARSLHYRTMAVTDALFLEPNPTAIKQALEWMGLPAGPLRPPLERMSAQGQGILREVLVSGGWLPA
jgi:4-hydroxy-tetrahydrodipicolinate synthase